MTPGTAFLHFQDRRLREDPRSSAGGDPELVGHDKHHEDDVEAERPQDSELMACKVAARNRTLLGGDELIVLEGREDEILFGGEGSGLWGWRHCSS
jgi:hypothetical protein